MKKSKQNEGLSDLIPGGAAVLAFLAMAALLHLPLWLGAVLAFAVYVGVKWTLPQKQVAEEAPISTRERLRTLQTLAGQLHTTDVQHRLRRVCETADTLLTYSERFPEKSADSPLLVRQYLELAQMGVNLLLESAPQQSNSESRHKLNELLDNVEQRFTQLHRRLLADDDAALAGEIKVLTQTMNELDQMVLTVGESHEK